MCAVCSGERAGSRDIDGLRTSCVRRVRCRTWHSSCLCPYHVHSDTLMPNTEFPSHCARARHLECRAHWRGPGLRWSGAQRRPVGAVWGVALELISRSYRRRGYIVCTFPCISAPSLLTHRSDSPPSARRRQAGARLDTVQHLL